MRSESDMIYQRFTNNISYDVAIVAKDRFIYWLTVGCAMVGMK